MPSKKTFETKSSKEGERTASATTKQAVANSVKNHHHQQQAVKKNVKEHVDDDAASAWTTIPSRYSNDENNKKQDMMGKCNTSNGPSYPLKKNGNHKVHLPMKINSRWKTPLEERDSEEKRFSERFREESQGKDRNGGRHLYFGPRRNKRGFHGNMVRDRQVEVELFEQNKPEGNRSCIDFDKYNNVPVDVIGSNVDKYIDVYSEETVGKDMARITKLCGYEKPTPIQKYSIPIVASAQQDLMACAQTGSGKTFGFLCPIIMSMIRQGGSRPPPYADRGTAYPEALVLAPTRELAGQIYDEATKFTYRTGIAPAIFYGGAEVRIEQLRQLGRGCDMVIATPGRLIDLVERGKVAMDNVRHLCLDEADRMLDMGFEIQIRRIVEDYGMPSKGVRQTLMFSATFPDNIRRLADDFLKDYVFLTVGRLNSASNDIIQSVLYVENHDKIDALFSVLLSIEDGLILVFTETKRSCATLERLLRERCFPVCSIHGDKTQQEREDALSAFKSGQLPVMIATDVASRGLDISNVSYVINYDLPRNIDSYIHRIGRTGRAGSIGNAISFLNDLDNSLVIREVQGLLETNNQKVPHWLRDMCSYYERKSYQRDHRTVNRTRNCERKQRTLSPDFSNGRHDCFSSRQNGTASNRTLSKARTTDPAVGSVPTIPPTIIALPGEDDNAALKRLEKKKQDAEEKAAAEKQAAEIAAKERADAYKKRLKEADMAKAMEAHLLSEFASGDKLGNELAEWCKLQGFLLPSVEKLVNCILAMAEKTGPDPECAWAEPSMYGQALCVLVEDNLSAQVEILWAIQQYCRLLDFPKVAGECKYLIQAMFREMYKYDLVNDIAFMEWKEDETVEHQSGKMDAIVQTLSWFDWLEEEEEELLDIESNTENYQSDMDTAVSIE